MELERRVAVTIWRLATNIEYRTLGELLGLGCSTVGKIVLETCQAIAKHLLHVYVHFPKDRELTHVIHGFDAKSGFPQVAGAIDGTHIPIIRPHKNATDYFNRKGYHSVVMQGVVDFRGLFTDVYIGWPGRVHDARIFSNSDLFVKGSNKQLFPDQTTTINGFNLPIVLVGDPAYPLLPWMMKPYPEHTGMPRKHQRFNYRLSKARITVEHAFGRLKGRWRCLLKRMDYHLDNVPSVVAACVVLYNICESLGDRCQDNWVVADDLNRRELGNEDYREGTSVGIDAPTSWDIRETFADYLCTL